MAITWTVSISNVDVDSKRADVSFVREDSESGSQENYSFSKAIIETSPQRSALLNNVWQQHLDKVSEATNVDTFIDGLEASAKANLEAREV